MDLSTGIRNLFENITYYPKFNIQAGHIQKYRIEMNNEYLNEKGDIVKRQKLVSDYTRKITDLPHDFYALTEITIDRVEFSSDKIQKPIRWTFAEGLKLPFYLYICNYLDDYKMIAEECDNGLIKQRNQEFADIFSAFPKLPSVDVFIMLAYDIIGFETLFSHAASKPLLFEEVGKFIKIHSLSATKCSWSMGLYSEDSYYENGDFFAAFQGYSLYRERPCSMIEYYCDHSSLRVVDDSKETARSREGNSFYAGIIHIDVDTGLIQAGTMLESIAAVQYKGEKKKIPVHVRRRIKTESY